MVDRVRPLKIEDPTLGGTETDLWPEGLDNNEDHVDVRGVVLQSNVSDDEAVIVSRDASGNLTFQDVANPVPQTLSDLTGGGLNEASHKALRTFLHNLDESYVRTPTVDTDGLISAIEWRQPGSNLIAREHSYTYSAEGIRTGEILDLYDVAGTSIIATLTCSMDPSTLVSTVTRS